MGSSKSKNRKPLETTRIMYHCSLIKIKLQEYKRSREAAITQKENEILKEIQQSKFQPRNQQVEVHQLSSIIENILYINAAETVIRKCEVVKECALTINQSQGRIESIKDISPFIENICWSNTIFGMDCINQFYSEMLAFFGQDLQQCIQSSENIDERVRRALAPSIIASYDDMNGYVNNFCCKYNMPIEVFNESIHNFTYIQNPNNSYNALNSNMNIYSTPTNISTQSAASHYQTGFQPSNQYENELLASNRIQNSMRFPPQNEEKKNKFLFCF